MTIKIYKICLFKNLEGNVTPDEYTTYREMRSFRSYKDDVSAVKLLLNRHDEKRIVLYDQIHTLSHVYYKTK